MNKPDKLTGLIKISEKEMRLSLEKIRIKSNHSPTKGAKVESLINAFLQEYLPKNLSVVSGEIIDSLNNQSGQVDTIILNEYHPFNFTEDKVGLFFIEGVSGAGEIKTNLSSTGLIDTINRAEKIKMLIPKIGKGISYATQSDINRYYTHSPFFLFAFDSQINLDTIKTTLEQSNKMIGQTIDAVFILNKGWLINFGDGKGSFQFITPQKHSIEGWVYQKSTSVLFNFLRFISLTIPRMIRFEPILTNYMFK